MDLLTEKRLLPDVAGESSLELYPPLNWVGMSDISLPVMMEVQGRLTTLSVRLDAQVSLDRQGSRGIHMSRLYSLVQEHFAEKAISLTGLVQISEDFLRSHQDLSSSSRLRIRTEMPVQRKALKSGHQSWRTYPVTWKVENRQGQVRIWLEVEVLYSSTCPASAALSRQLIQENFKAHFNQEDLRFDEVHHWLGSTQGILATPHAQRSFAQVGVEVAGSSDLNLLSLIDLVEDALQTPVQTLVKREDEQEFARRNGQNLMFCEDACRRIQAQLLQEDSFKDYWIHVNHQESLHPHNAVCFLSKTPQSQFKAIW